MLNSIYFHGKNEYQSIILASLLHDIGKFLHRHPDANEDHEYYSMKFIDDLSNQFGNAEWFKYEMLKELVGNHSTPSKVRNEWKEYAKIVFLADSYSSGERDTEQSKAKGTWYKNKPLDSIFSLIKLDGRIRPIDLPSEDGRKNNFRHNLTLLEPLVATPVPIKQKLEKDEVQDLIINFKRDVLKISSNISFDNFFVTFLSLLERYLWCVPSDTRYDISDISLYDHLKSSSAIAACLFKFYFENEDIVGEEIKKQKEELVLVGGEIRGIQNYIYDIASSIEGKISKRLRARSFFITALVDVVTHKILHDLDLPFSCNLITAGGHLQILIPNTKIMIRKLEHSADDINEWLYRNYFGEINISLNWKNEKGEVAISKDQLKVYHFFREAEVMHDQLAELKLKKFKPQLIKDGRWIQDNFKMNEDLYLKYKTPCQICHKFPAVKTDDDRVTQVCNMCYLDKVIGKKLANAKYLIFSRKKIEDKSLSFFNKYWISVSNSNKNVLKNKKIYLVQSLDSYFENEIFEKGIPITRRLLANHIPIIHNKKEHLNEVCAYCSSHDRCNYKDELKKGDPFTFSCLAALSVDKETGKGSQLIGILKMDIDHLGYIFGRGFKDIKEDERIDRVTISRYLTLSRMIDLFFCGWVQQTIAKDEKFNKIYAVFSGGDDLLVLGPWETIIHFSQYLYKEFRKYVCENESMTISGAIAVVKPNFPIARGATLVNELLKISKREGRNRLTIFGTTVQWEYVEELFQFADLLIKKMKPREDNEGGEKKQKKSKFTSAFLYRLLTYRNMYLDFINRHSIRGLLYCSKLIYDVNRNIYEIGWEKGKRVIKNADEVKEVVDRIFKYFIQMPFGNKKKALIEFINIPVIWALYKNRGGSND